MKSISWYLARHYLPIRGQDSSISVMALISLISIGIGAFSLALVTAVMNGFQVTIQEKMQNIQPQATIYSYKQPIVVKEISSFIAEKFPEITAVSPYGISHVMVQSDAMEEGDTPVIAAFKAIDPEKESLTTSLKNRVKEGGQLSLIQDNVVMIGKTMANNLDVLPDDEITLLFIEQPTGKKRKVDVHQKKVRIGAIFETGIEEYDNGTMYGSFDLFNELFPDQGVTQLGLAVNPTVTPAQVIPRLREETGLQVLTWQELYKPLLSAQIIEKYAMFLILLLITLVASMNIIALIFMIITHKRSDIAILRAMGLSSKAIVRAFILLGVLLSGVACIVGLIGATIASWLLERYPFITLPDIYYVTHLPAHMDWHVIAAVFCVVMLIAFLASWFSARRVYTINIARVLRFEG